MMDTDRISGDDIDFDDEMRCTFRGEPATDGRRPLRNASLTRWIARSGRLDLAEYNVDVSELVGEVTVGGDSR
jgi:hypothetical protein